MHHFGGRCGETMELEGGEPTIYTPQHLSRHSNGIRDNERFWFNESRNWVRRYDNYPALRIHAVGWCHEISRTVRV